MDYEEEFGHDLEFEEGQEDIYYFERQSDTFTFKDFLHGFCVWCASSLIVSLFGYVLFEAVMR